MQLVLPQLWLLILLSVACQRFGDTCPIAQYYQFYIKDSLNDYEIIKNPYKNPSTQYLNKVKQNMSNKNRVCALKYLNQEKTAYDLKNFGSRQQAEKANWIVTHQGGCGKCSTTKDLFVYLTTDLTKPVRACGLKRFYSKKALRQCISNLGFTDPCTEVWLWNTLNTKKKCGIRCFWSYLTQQPYIVNGELNKCLQCDQDISGPIFKYESGRTRRNSGIKSQIDRPSDQVYNLTHCYY